MTLKKIKVGADCFGVTLILTTTSSIKGMRPKLKIIYNFMMLIMLMLIKIMTVLTLSNLLIMWKCKYVKKWKCENVKVWTCKKCKRLNKTKKEGKGKKMGENEHQFVSICIQFAKRKTRNIGRNVQNFKKWPADLSFIIDHCHY